MSGEVGDRSRAERVFADGRVLTLEAADTVAEAVAVGGGGIPAVGSRERAMRCVR